MPAMATGTVADERTERKRELETTRKESDAAMAKYVAAESRRRRETVRSRTRRSSTTRGRRWRLCAMALQAAVAAYRADRSDGKALAGAQCGRPMRHAGRRESPVETVLGRVEVSMARHACAGKPDDGAGAGYRGFDDAGGVARSERDGSSCCCAGADKAAGGTAGLEFRCQAHRAHNDARRRAPQYNGMNRLAGNGSAKGGPHTEFLTLACARLEPVPGHMPDRAPRNPGCPRGTPPVHRGWARLPQQHPPRDRARVQ